MMYTVYSILFPLNCTVSCILYNVYSELCTALLFTVLNTMHPNVHSNCSLYCLCELCTMIGALFWAQQCTMEDQNAHFALELDNKGFLQTCYQTEYLLHINC